MLDSMHRLERVGFAGYASGPLVRQVLRGYGANYREAGHLVLAEPFHSPAETPAEVIARSPKLRAMVRYVATHAAPKLPFTAADRADLSDGGARVLRLFFFFFSSPNSNCFSPQVLRN